MRITFRLIVSLVVSVAAVAACSAYFHVQQEKSRLNDEMERRSRLLAESLQESVQPAIQKGLSANLQRLVEKSGNRERVTGMAVYDAKGKALAMTERLAPGLSSVPSLVTNALGRDIDLSAFETVGNGRMHVYVLPLNGNDGVVGALAVFQDASYIQSQLGHIWRIAFFRVSVQVLLITLVTLLVVRWSIVSPIARMVERMRDEIDKPGQRQRAHTGADANQDADESPFPKKGGTFANFGNLSEGAQLNHSFPHNQFQRAAMSLFSLFAAIFETSFK